jgi:hypothetical protein
VRRDLFAEGDAGVYLTDAALLERLAQDKLAGIAAEVKAEGWAWVDATPGVTHADLHAFQRAPRERREPNKREAQRIEKLQAKMHAIGRSRGCRAGSRRRGQGRRCKRKAKPWASSCRRWKMACRTTART